MSLEIPVNAMYYILADMGNVFKGAGSYAGYNLRGKYLVKVNGEKVTDEDIDFSGEDKDFNAFDYGLNFLAGYKLNNGFLINAGYGLGLRNLNAEGNTTNKNKVISFGIGYQF